MALSDNLISYWSLDEASGNAIDAHGSNDLTDNNTVGATTGIINGARSFDAASNEYFSKADNTDLSLGDIDFSFQAWVKLNSKNVVQCVSVKGNNVVTEHELFYSSATDRFCFYVENTTHNVTVRADTLGPVSTGVWYHIICYHDSVNDVVGISVNDGGVDTLSYSFGSQDTPFDFFIGTESGFGAYFRGLIDEVGFWKRVLTSGEITDLYNGGAGRDYSYIVGGAANPFTPFFYRQHIAGGAHGETA